MTRPEQSMGLARTVKVVQVFPGDTNNHGTLFGGILMGHIDELASVVARRHARRPVVTASNDGVHFHRPIQQGHIVCLEAFVSSVGTTSMEIFVKIITEDGDTGERQLAAVSFLTFVALDDLGRPTPVPRVRPETAEERQLYAGHEERRRAREAKRAETVDLVAMLGTGRRQNRDGS